MSKKTKRLRKPPKQLRTRDQWIVRDESKVPAFGAKPDDPHTWVSFRKAIALASKKDLPGVGFVFSADDPYIGIDLDKCRNPKTRELMPWAAELVDRFRSYTEVSPSGTGVHIIIRVAPRLKHRFRRLAEAEGDRRAKHQLKLALESIAPEIADRANAPKIEVFYERQYLTYTGRVLKGRRALQHRPKALRWFYRRYPTLADPHAAALKPDGAQVYGPPKATDLATTALLKRIQKHRPLQFEHFFTTGYRTGDDRSDVDYGCARLLAEFVGHDPERIEALMREHSKLSRPKWDEPRRKTTWLGYSIRNALARPFTPKLYRELADNERQGALRVSTLANVEMRPVTWLWENWLPLGKLVVLDGFPGQGKSAAMLDIAARGSRGKPLPDDTRGALGKTPWETLILTYEDDPRDTLRPRLKAAGGDANRVHFVEGVEYDGAADVLPPTLPKDLEALERRLKELPHVRLLVIDPLTASLAGEIDSHRDQDVRRVLSRLARMAEAYNLCIVVIRHVRKAPGTNSITAGGGSIGIIAQARVGLLIDRDPDNDDQSVLAVTKSNIGPKPTSLAFARESTALDGPKGSVINTMRLAWQGDSPHSADAMLLSREQNGETDPRERWEVDRWMQRVFEEEGGRIERGALMKAAKRAGYSQRTIQRAAQRLDVRYKKKGFGIESETFWRLPDASAPAAPRARAHGVHGAYGANGEKRTRVAKDVVM